MVYITDFNRSDLNRLLFSPSPPTMVKISGENIAIEFVGTLFLLIRQIALRQMWDCF